MDAETPRSIAIRFSAVTKQFGSVKAVDDLSLEIVDGEFFSMLGPSGSGKTTCLRMIAGFEQPTAGSITLHDKEMAGVPPYERDVNTVFQDYALFPHMTVEDNIGYGLMIRKAPKAERRKRVHEMLELAFSSSDCRACRSANMRRLHSVSITDCWNATSTSTL